LSRGRGKERPGQNQNRKEKDQLPSTPSGKPVQVHAIESIRLGNRQLGVRPTSSGEGNTLTGGSCGAAPEALLDTSLGADGETRRNGTEGR